MLNSLRFDYAIKLLIVLAWISLSISSVPAVAEFIVASPESGQIAVPITVGEKQIPREQLISDLLSAAFTDTLWGESKDGRIPVDSIGQYYWSHQNNGNEYTAYKYRDKSISWLDEYVYRPNGWPRHNAINKWAGEISIALGWPSTSISSDKSSPRDHFINPWNEGADFHRYSVAINHIKKLIPVISKETRLPVIFIDPTDPSDNTNKKYGRIRIILSGVTSGFELDKTFGGVQFLVNRFDKERVDVKSRYFLPRSDNTIGLSVCRIDRGRTDDELKALITECLLRSMGFPSAIKSAPLMSTPDSVLLAPVIDTRQELTDYDRKMLSVLYCDEIKPGMDKNAVLNALVVNEKCLK